MKFTKFNKVLAILILMAAVIMPASAQLGFDLYKGTRAVVPPIGVQNLLGNYTVTTNFFCDLGSYDGKCVIDIFAPTNTANSGGTLTIQFWGSNTNVGPSQANASLTAITNFAYVNTSTLVLQTNSYYYYGTNNPLNMISSNLVVYPGTVTTIGSGYAWQNLYQGTYLSDSGTSYYTNTGPITISGNGTVAYTQVSFNIKDQPKYIWYCLQPGGTVTNFTFAMVMHAVNKVGP